MNKKMQNKFLNNALNGFFNVALFLDINELKNYCENLYNGNYNFFYNREIKDLHKSFVYNNYFDIVKSIQRHLKSITGYIIEFTYCEIKRKFFDSTIRKSDDKLLHIEYVYEKLSENFNIFFGLYKHNIEILESVIVNNDSDDYVIVELSLKKSEILFTKIHFEILNYVCNNKEINKTDIDESLKMLLKINNYIDGMMKNDINEFITNMTTYLKSYFSCKSCTIVKFITYSEIMIIDNNTNNFSPIVLMILCDIMYNLYNESKTLKCYDKATNIKYVKKIISSIKKLYGRSYQLLSKNFQKDIYDYAINYDMRHKTIFVIINEIARNIDKKYLELLEKYDLGYFSIIEYMKDFFKISIEMNIFSKFEDNENSDNKFSKIPEYYKNLYKYLCVIYVCCHRTLHMGIPQTDEDENINKTLEIIDESYIKLVECTKSIMILENKIDTIGIKDNELLELAEILGNNLRIIYNNSLSDGKYKK